MEDAEEDAEHTSTQIDMLELSELKHMPNSTKSKPRAVDSSPCNSVLRFLLAVPLGILRTYGDHGLKFERNDIQPKCVKGQREEKSASIRWHGFSRVQ